MSWRDEVLRILTLLESDPSDLERTSVASLVYFLGEVQSDGLIGYLDRHDASDLDNLKTAAEVIQSDELKSVLNDVDEAIAKLPDGEDLYDRISSQLNESNEDPFDEINGSLVEILPIAEMRIEKYVRGVLGRQPDSASPA